MKSVNNLRPCFIALIIISAFAALNSQKPLADIYKSGKVSYVPELTIDENSLPENLLFENPNSIACDNEGNVYVADFKANDIKKFDPSGKFIKVIGRKGQGPGEFDMPMYVAFAAGRLIVWDMANRRFCILSPDGEFIKSRVLSTEEGWPWGMRSLPNGDIVLEVEKIDMKDPDKSQERFLQVYSSEMEFKKTVYSHKVWRNKFRPNVRANIPIPYSAQVCWDVSPDGKIVVGYAEKYEIEIHDTEKGRLSTFNHTYDQVNITDKEKELWFSRISVTTPEGIKRGAPDYIVKNTEFPKFKPAFDCILVDSEGNILVHTYRKNRDEDPRFFDAFDPKGNFIGGVYVEGDEPFPRGWDISFINGCFWMPKIGKDELYKIIKYRISNGLLYKSQPRGN
jgi:hypothetical protein